MNRCLWRITRERSSIQSIRKEVRDVPVVAGGAQRGAAWLSAVLREGRGGARAVPGAQGPAEDARHDVPEMEQVGEAVKGHGSCQD